MLYDHNNIPIKNTLTNYEDMAISALNQSAKNIIEMLKKPLLFPGESLILDHRGNPIMIGKRPEKLTFRRYNNLKLNEGSMDNKDATIWRLQNECNHAKRYFRFIMEGVADSGKNLAERFLKEFGDKDYIKQPVNEVFIANPDWKCRVINEGGRLMDFGYALNALREGCRVQRAGWNGKNMWIVLQKGYPNGIPINKNTAEAIGEPEGTVHKFLPYLMFKTAQGDFVPWLASQTDILASDWRILGEGE